MAFNRNKRSLAVDLKREGGLEVLQPSRRPAPTCSCRACGPAPSRSWGSTSRAAAALNPRLVYCSITAFGTRGPLAHRPGYDPLMQAYGGLMSVNGHPGQEPARVGTSIVDMGTGMWAALGILAALRERDRTGRAVEVTTALFDTALMWVVLPRDGLPRLGRGPAAAGLGHRDDRALPGASQRRRLGDDRRRLGRAVRHGSPRRSASPSSRAIRASRTIPRA